MASVELDLRGVVLPVCLLKCKTALMGMDSREGLDILISDPHVVEDLVKIIRRSQGLSVRPHREGDHYRLRISGQAGGTTFRTTAGTFQAGRKNRGFEEP